MRHLFGLMAVLTTFSGCWNKEYNEPGRIAIEPKPTEMVFNGSFQRSWAAVQATMAKFSIVKKDIDSTTGRAYMVTDWIRGKSDILYHGFDVNRIPYVIRYKLYIYVVGDLRGSQTKVSIKNVEQYLDDVVTAGVDVQGSVNSWIKTESSTLKENALLEQMNRLVRDPQFKSDMTD